MGLIGRRKRQIAELGTRIGNLAVFAVELRAEFERHSEKSNENHAYLSQLTVDQQDDLDSLRRRYEAALQVLGARGGIDVEPR